MILINLTKHSINIVMPSGEFRRIPPSGKIARYHGEVQELPSLDGIPTISCVGGCVKGLPPEREGVVYLVSGIVFESCLERDDLAAPDMSIDSIVLDKRGRRIAVRKLRRREGKRNGSRTP